MNFGLSKKYSTIDFEEVNLADLMLIGGGCGGGGGGGGSTTVTASNAQQTAQASSQAGTNVSINVTTPGGSLTWGGSYSYDRTNGVRTSGNFQVSVQTGNVSATVNSQSGTSWWSSFTSWVRSWWGS